MQEDKSPLPSFVDAINSTFLKHIDDSIVDTNNNTKKQLGGTINTTSEDDKFYLVVGIEMSKILCKVEDLIPEITELTDVLKSCREATINTTGTRSEIYSNTMRVLWVWFDGLISFLDGEFDKLQFRLRMINIALAMHEKEYTDKQRKSKIQTDIQDAIDLFSICHDSMYNLSNLFSDLTMVRNQLENTALDKLRDDITLITEQVNSIQSSKKEMANPFPSIALAVAASLLSGVEIYFVIPWLAQADNTAEREEVLKLCSRIFSVYDAAENYFTKYKFLFEGTNVGLAVKVPLEVPEKSELAKTAEEFKLRALFSITKVQTHLLLLREEFFNYR